MHMKKLLLLFFLSFSISSYSVNLIVNNAGIEEVNGEYSHIGYYNERPRFVKEDISIFYTYDWGCTPKWIIEYQGVMVYKNYDSSFLPPYDYWNLTCFGNIEPTPTIERIDNYLTFSSFYFVESSQNDGTIAQNPITVSLHSKDNIKFNASINEDLYLTNKVELLNLPEDLYPEIIVINDTMLNILLKGTAISQNFIQNIEICFKNSAFSNNDTSEILGHNIDFFSIYFYSLIEDNMLDNIKIKYYNDEIHILSVKNYSDIKNLYIYNIEGKRIFSENKITTDIIEMNLTENIYICIIETRKYKKSLKFIVH